MSAQLVGAFLVSVSAVGFGVMPILALYAYAGGANVASLLVLRFSLTSMALFACIAGQGTKVQLTRRQLLSLAVLGGVLYALQANLYLHAVRFVSPALAALVLYTYPVLVALLSFVIDREVIQASTALAILLCFAGVAMIVGVSGAQANLTGILLALGAAATYSCYIVVSNRVIKQLPPLVTSAFVALFAALSLLVTGAATHALQFSFSAQAWLAILGVTLFSTIMAMLTFFAGLERIGSTRAAIISAFEPLVTTGFSALLFHERLTALQAAGGLAVLLGAILVIAGSHRIHGAEPGVQPTLSQ